MAVRTCKHCGAEFECAKITRICLACKRAHIAAWARRYRAGATTKVCRRCGIEYTNRKWQQFCDPCRKATKVAKDAAYYKRHRDERREASNARSRAWHAANRERAKQTQLNWLRRKQLKAYSAPADYDTLLRAQNNVCAICLSPCRRGRRLAIDHDHQTGSFRGLLCGSCNWALGLFRDDPTALIRAADYVHSGGVAATHFQRSGVEARPQHSSASVIGAEHA